MHNNINICLVFYLGLPWEAWTEVSLRTEDERKNLRFIQSIHHLVVELTSTLRIKIFRHLEMYLGGYIAQDVFNAVFTWYVVFVLMQNTSVASNLLDTMATF